MEKQGMLPGRPWTPWALACVMCLIASFGWAQSIDSFDVQANGKNIQALEQPDGKLLVWGDFSILTGQPRPGIGRFLPGDILDLQFVPQGTPAIVYCVAVQEDGKLLVGGHTREGEKALVRLMVDGSLDPAFSPACLPWWASVHSLSIDPNGTILVGGIFYTPEGNTNLTRLDMNGSEVAGFSATAVLNGAGPSKVNSLVIQPDGNLLVGGVFNALCGHPRTNLGRLHPDGSLDMDFSPAEVPEVQALALEPDGQVLVGSWNLFRLNPSGTQDETFRCQAKGVVQTIMAQTDGSILIGGNFSELAGFQGTGFARLSADGTVAPGGFVWANLPVYSLSMQSDGRILAGGMFDQIGNAARDGFARLQAFEPEGQGYLSIQTTALEWFRPGHLQEIAPPRFYSSPDAEHWTFLGAGERVQNGWSLAGVEVRPDVYYRAVASVAEGMFNGSQSLVEERYGPPVFVSHPQDQVVRPGKLVKLSAKALGSRGFHYSQWLKDGVPFASGMSDIEPGWIASLILTNVGLLDAGRYSAVARGESGNVTSRVASLTVLAPVPLIESAPEPQACYLGSNATFSVSVEDVQSCAYQWKKDGIDMPGETGSSLNIKDAQFDSQGDYQVIVSNSYGSVTSAPVALVVYLPTDGFDPGSGASVRAFAETSEGKIFVAGQYETIAGQSCTNIGRLNPDGTFDSTFQAQLAGSVNCVAIQPDGKMLIGGLLISAGGEPRRGLVRFNPDGSLDVAFKPEFVGPRVGPRILEASVSAVAVAPDGKILAGGQFSSLGGAERNSLARLNPEGTLDPTFDPGMQGVITNAIIDAIVLQPDGKILVGGHQMRFGGVARMALARLHPDGSLDPSLSTDAQTWITALTLQADGSILLAGHIVSVGEKPRKGLARILSDGTVDPGFRPALTGDPATVVPQANGKILVGGNLSELDGQSCGNLIRLLPDGTLDRTFNCDANGAIRCLALQRDGKILAGGSFTRLGGQSRRSIGRLINTDPASESLSFDGAVAQWTVQGGSPGLVSASFDVSSNGLNWASIGEGVAVKDGWKAGQSGAWRARRKSGLDAADPIGFVRARGTVVGGAENCAKWVVERMIKIPSSKTPPVLLLNHESAGGTADGFPFSIIGDWGQVIVLESSTNLLNWTPVQTNRMETAPIPCALSRTSRSLFLRARLSD